MEHEFIEDNKYKHIASLITEFDNFKFKYMLSDLIKNTDINILKKKRGREGGGAII